MAAGVTWGRFDRAVAAGLVTGTAASVAGLLASGAGFVLDDWFVLRNAEFRGAWDAAGTVQGTARPGTFPIFALVFGVFGRHPLPGFLLLAVVNAATAVVTYRLLWAFVPRWQAAVAAMLWVVLPTHTSTELWLTCIIIATSQLCLTSALALAALPNRTRRQEALAWALLAASVLTYEASLPLAAVGVIGVAWLVERRVPLRFTLGSLVAVGLSGLWIVTHWYSGKHVQQAADPVRLVQANFGWGITPNGPFSPLADPLVLLALAGISVAAARVLLPSWRARTDEWLVLAGLLVLVLGYAPFIRYYYEPQGAGDRANYLSAVGGAMVWAGLMGLVARVDRRLAGIGLVGLLALAVPARIERIEVWSTAGLDAQAIAEAVVASHPDPSEPIVLGPGPIVRWNVAAIIDHSNVHGALALAYGTEDIDVQLPLTPGTWDRTPRPQRFDIRRISRLDDLDVLAG